jgi:hypothetical protein
MWLSLGFYISFKNVLLVYINLIGHTLTQFKYATADLKRNVLFTNRKYGHIPHSKFHVPKHNILTARLIMHSVNRMTE